MKENRDIATMSKLINKYHTPKYSSKKERRDYYLKHPPQCKKEDKEHADTELNLSLKSMSSHSLVRAYAKNDGKQKDMIKTKLMCRDVMHLIDNKIEVTWEAIDDASILLMHLYCKRDDEFLGLVSWLISEFSTVVNLGYNSINNGVYCTYYKSRYWFYEYKKNNKPLLLGISDNETLNNKKMFSNNCKLCIHAINRVTTRFFNLFVNNAFLFGIGIVRWVYDLIESEIKKIAFKFTEKCQIHINHNGMNFVLRKNQVYSIVTVF